MTISFPRPQFSNPAIMPEDYKPSVFGITSITQEENPTVTTAVNHNFVIGQDVRFIIPVSYGMRQLNGRSAIVTSVPADNQFIAKINTSNFDAFTNPGTDTPAQVKAIGDINSGVRSSTGNIFAPTIPGSFQNIST